MPSTRRRALVVAALACAFAWTMQGGGAPQNSNYALVRALADGTPQIDRTRFEVGEAGTSDVIEHDGHVFSNKAPGLSFVTLPLYLVADSAGAIDDDDPIRALWLLTLLGAVVPSIALVLLVMRVVDRFEPGLGLPAAAVLAAGTIVLEYAGLYFGHALAALLAFASFALLASDRRRRWPAVAAAGAFAGLAVVVEYQSVLAVAVLGLYALRDGPRVRRALAFGAGAAAGVSPLIAYNQWAFGSPLQLSYGFRAGERHYGALPFVGPPNVPQMLELLFSTMGLLVLTPIVACALAGLVLLYRREHRAESLAASALFGAYLVYLSGFYSPFGGLGPPRFFVPLLPFLALGVASFWRRFPVTTTVAALLSTTIVVSSAATYTLASYDSRWFVRLRDGDVPLTALSLVGITGWYAILPFFAAVAVALAVALRRAPSGAASRDGVYAAILPAGWALVAAAAPQPVDLHGAADEYGSYWAPALVAVGAVLVLLPRSHLVPRRRSRAPV